YRLRAHGISPDEIRSLGGLDELVVLVLAVDLFLDGVPEDVLKEKLAELEIDRSPLPQDIARTRRLPRGALRKTIRRIPELLGQAGAAIEGSGVGPRLRGWIN